MDTGIVHLAIIDNGYFYFHYFTAGSYMCITTTTMRVHVRHLDTGHHTYFFYLGACVLLVGSSYM